MCLIYLFIFELVLQSYSWLTPKYCQRRVSLSDKVFNAYNEMQSSSNHIPSIYEINKKLLLSNSLSNRILDSSGSAAGHVGIILNLETALVDTIQIMGYAFAILAGELQQETIPPLKIKASLGSPFIDQITAFGWKIADKGNVITIEQHLHSIIDNLINKLPILPYKGANSLIYDVLNQHNDITILSRLPRTLSKKLLGESGLSECLEGRISGDHLICPDQHNSSIDIPAYNRINNYYRNLLIKSCIIMQKPPILCTLVDGNHENLLTAKRNGFNCIALTGKLCLLFHFCLFII